MFLIFIYNNVKFEIYFCNNVISLFPFFDSVMFLGSAYITRHIPFVISLEIPFTAMENLRAV